MPPEVLLVSLAGVGMATFLGWGILRAINRHLERQHELERARIAGTLGSDDVRGELDDVRGRLAEMEERLEFAERLLARERDSDRLKPG